MTSDQLAALVRRIAPEYGLDPELTVKQCAAESSLDCNVPNSRTGAMGVMQLEPVAVADLKTRFAFCCDAHNPESSIRGAGVLMRWLNKRYGDPAKACAAYNWGAGNLDKCVARFGPQWRAHLPAETKQYLHKIVGPEPAAEKDP